MEEKVIVSAECEDKTNETGKSRNKLVNIQIVMHNPSMSKI